MGITHEYVSAQPQGSDPNLVSKNEWNAAHVNVNTWFQISTNTVLDSSQAGERIETSSSPTLTLPPANTVTGKSYFIIQTDAGTTTIAGTVNGDSGGYVLVNQYQYVEIESDGTSYFVVRNN